MLVLTRKINESIFINSTIEVRVLRTTKNKVTIGLVAPHEMPICRGELQPQLAPETGELVHARAIEFALRAPMTVGRAVVAAELPVVGMRQTRIAHKGRRDHSGWRNRRRRVAFRPGMPRPRVFKV